MLEMGGGSGSRSNSSLSPGRDWRGKCVPLRHPSGNDTFLCKYLGLDFDL